MFQAVFLFKAVKWSCKVQNIYNKNNEYKSIKNHINKTQVVNKSKFPLPYTQTETQLCAKIGYNEDFKLQHRPPSTKMNESEHGSVGIGYKLWSFFANNFPSWPLHSVLLGMKRGLDSGRPSTT